jgi:hypothetical protein
MRIFVISQSKLSTFLGIRVIKQLVRQSMPVSAGVVSPNKRLEPTRSEQRAAQTQR